MGELSGFTQSDSMFGGFCTQQCADHACNPPLERLLVGRVGSRGNTEPVAKKSEKFHAKFMRRFSDHQQLSPVSTWPHPL